MAKFLGHAGRKFNVRVSSICKGPPPGLRGCHSNQKTANPKLQIDQANSKLAVTNLICSDFNFDYSILFFSIFITYLSSEKLKLFDCSLSQFSLIIFVPFFILFRPFFSSIFFFFFQAINFLFSKRKVLAQSFEKSICFKVKACKERAKFKSKK